jgi:hypothetical protein
MIGATAKKEIQESRNTYDPFYEKKRQKALRMIYDLKYTFKMEDLARAFLHEYIESNAQRRGTSRSDLNVEDLITSRLICK